MKTKEKARLFDVRISNPGTYTVPVAGGGTKTYPRNSNIHLIVVAETAGRANEMALEQYPEASVYQINHHGGESRILIDDQFIE